MKRLKLSLKEKAIIGIIATLIPILITFVLVYRQNRVYLKNRVLDTLTVIAEAYEGQVYQFLEMAKRRSQDFASDGFVRTQLQKIMHGNISAVSKLNKHLVRNKLLLDKTINTISILSLEGRVVASTNNADIGRDFSSETIFLQGKETVTIVEKCFGHCKLTEIAISAPILNKDTGRLIGVIVNYIPIAELDNIVTGKYSHDLGAVSWAKGKGAWKTLEIYLVNRDKRMITKSIFVKDAVWKQVVDTLPINEGLTSNKEITGFYRDYRGVEVAGASMYIPSMKWVLLVEIDKDEVLSPVRRILISALITTAVVIIMIALLFFGFLKKMVKPLQKISDAAESIASGNFDVSIPVQAGDEIGALCESFNYMTRHIKARTTALAKSESRLSEAQRIARIGNWEWDVIKNEVSWSYEAYRIFGMAQEKFVSPFETFLNHVHPDDREFVRKSIDDSLNTKKPLDIDHRILQKDAIIRIVHEKAVVISDNTGRVVQMVGTVQDITERKRMEEEVGLLKTLTISIAEAKNLHDALVVTLEKVCSATGWIYGEAWIPDPDGKRLVRDHAFYSKIESLKKFSELSGTFTFPPGVGLPGRIWSLRQPVWVRDVTADQNFPRAPVAREVGLKAAIGFPVFSEKEIVAVLVFYMLEALEKDERLVSFVSSVVVQLGQVIKRKKAEELLCESEEKLRAILDNATAVVYTKNTQNQYTFINKQFEKLFHIKREEIKDKTDYDLWPREMADAFIANDLKVIDANTPLEFEEVALHEDGPHIYISVKFPLRDHTGRVYAVCGISTDITAHKHADELLKEQSRLASLGAEVGFALAQKDTLRGILQNCAEAVVRNLNVAFTRIWTLNREENVLELQSSAGIYTHIDGPHSRVPVGMYKIGLIARERKPHLTNKVIGDPRIHNQEWAEKTGMVAFAGYPLIVEDHLVGVMAMFSTKPITEIAFKALASVSDVIALGIERKQTEEEKSRLREQLFHSQKLESVGTLAGGIAHDFNNMLTAIIGYGNLLQMEMKEVDPPREYVQKILKSAEKAANLTKGLLAFSRKQPTNLAPVNVNDIVKEVESLLSMVIREDIKFKTALTDKECIVMADDGQMEQVLMNLATNARDAMPAGGELTILTDVVEFDNKFIKAHGFGEIGRYAMISVSDTGGGMDEQTRERIFDPFFTTKEVGKGTGLGLAIVYGIINQHKGYISVDSEVGKGSTFIVYLPLIKSEIRKREREVRTAFKGGTETILVAEDGEEVRSLIKLILEGHGYRVIEAVDGKDAVNKFKENKDKIHLLLFDVIMPGMNGKESYDAIRQIKPDIKALFTSGYSREVIMKDMFKAGSDFISKPVLPTELLKKVREALDT
ncbi:MAG TPA: GAF domain-containing protein [Candidatus Wunengus sp. YC60]|uniref:GAF domain-containing protein n=1 Tax=Candidatus Wunengus sp. YC60 TaxID=3367697 RepID=UPI004029D684